MSINHYENFPVGSWALPRRLRPAVHAIYRFARTADDLADEGEATPAERLAALAAYRQALARIEAGDTPADDPVFTPLAAAIAAHTLPMAPFYDLLSAFEQDVTTTRYADFGEVVAYCRRSANPVGRLLLALYRVDDDLSLRQSDAICSALQLINFWQDLGVDASRGRLYVPATDGARHGVTEGELLTLQDGPAVRALVTITARALASATRMVEAQPEDALAIETLAAVYAARREGQQARRHYRDAVRYAGFDGGHLMRIASAQVEQQFGLRRNQRNNTRNSYHSTHRPAG